MCPLFHCPLLLIILIFSFVASLGKYTFRMHNPYLFTDCNIENGVAVVRMLEGWKIVTPAQVHISLHLSKQVSNSFTVTGWAEKVFIRYRGFLLPKTKRIKQ